MMTSSGKALASLGLVLSSALLTAQASHEPVAVAGVRPLRDEANRLERQFVRVVTYEEPVWRWSGDIEPTGLGGFLPKRLSFMRPADEADDLGLILARTLAAYHQQTEGPRFAVLTSRYGLHIVPTQVRDEAGRWVEAVNPLDAKITVPQAERTAREHFVAVLKEVSSATGVGMTFLPSTVSRTPGVDPFEDHFAVGSSRFSWGTSETVARDAVLDLLERSATTYSWHNGCDAKAKSCFFSISELQRKVAGPNGRLTDELVLYDRCPSCAEAIRNRPAPAQPAAVWDFKPIGR
jgi:hypothetical protein